ncbi:hypothetical protein SAMN02745225_00748 [Ferrithrix thermotolerans DSM 19514]|jgi:hypothetical protein|uniref:Uncharacterized protein n=1 Tax=Ferrithrix thermotolerans DSM 19514 TaxID=1121881 RepID=A0A1M4TWY4_9ACTN|nr:hypothetical protein [Ferrithrix thermotolerans]SHE48807.1 hypothetical protein SAMN02745225_00748 [Ferrithrix thermotolerans DSM 19514]
MYAANLLTTVIGALINLTGPGHYIKWGFIQMSLANLILIILMIVVLFLAIVIPFPHRSGGKR